MLEILLCKIIYKINILIMLEIEKAKASPITPNNLAREIDKIISTRTRINVRNL